MFFINFIMKQNRVKDDFKQQEEYLTKVEEYQTEQSFINEEN